MNLKTDKKKDPLKGVYVFYSVIIALCILALFVFNLNIYAKAVLCTLAFLCVCIMRSLKMRLFSLLTSTQTRCSLSKRLSMSRQKPWKNPRTKPTLPSRLVVPLTPTLHYS